MSSTSLPEPTHWLCPCSKGYPFCGMISVDHVFCPTCGRKRQLMLADYFYSIEGGYCQILYPITEMVDMANNSQFEAMRLAMYLPKPRGLSDGE